MKRLAITALVLIACTSANLWADDTEIYGTVTIPSIEPNVMVLFDTSGSMATVDVPGDPYDPGQVYTCGSCSYSADAVYQQKWNDHSGEYEWLLFNSSINNIACDSIKNALQSQGYASGKIRASNFTCGGNNVRYLRMGNYLNYDKSGAGVTRSRINVAKDVLTDLIAETDGVRFGMFVFNFEQGGRLVAPCGTDKQTLLERVASATPNGWTPLSETLAEIGLYFAGQPSWFNTSGFPAGTYTSGHYVSPMQQRCQKNYVIIMTDGEPTHDRDSRLYSTPYINGDVIGDQDGDQTPCDPVNHREYWDPSQGCLAYPDSGSDYLDDVAQYLYEKDCNPTMGDGTSFDKQNITTFTIGFKVNNSLLKRTAAKGGGEYYTADNYSELKEAFSQIMSNIVEKNACYVAPVVPISRMNRTFAGDKIYLGFFKPQQSGNWIGNIKRYGLRSDGTLYDSKPAQDLVTTPDGLIKENALSWWTTLGNDGPAVEKGGAAEALSLFLESGGARNVYTYTGTQPLLTDASNAFTVANTALTKAMLGVNTDPERLSLIDTVRTGELGDIIHSEPAVVLYTDPAGNPTKTVIYVGANDGLLHAIDDDTGRELWSFVPADQLSRLYRLKDADHDYFVDGSPSVFYGTSQKIMVLGSRRGGESYTALDITTYNAPRHLYTIGQNILGPTPDTYEHLGQSWCRPEKATVATGSTVTTTGCGVNIAVSTVDAFIFGGGYDNNQDSPTPQATDGVGKAVFGVNMTTGALLNGLKITPTTHPSLGLTHSIVDVSAIDHDGDGIVSRLYFGDLGGNLFAMKDDQLQSFTLSECGKTVTKNVVDGVWSGMKLFNASADGVRRKIMYAPDAIGEKFGANSGEFLFFGTGDREHPGNNTVVNRFYAIKNDWTAASTLTESNLVDVTSNLIQLGTADQKQEVQDDLEAAKGWFIRLENSGEKVVSTPRVYGGVVYVTTYTPAAGPGPTPEDPCEASTARGVARLYALNYKTGAAVHEFSNEAETDNAGHPVTLGKKDRALAVGTAIPSAPVIAILDGGARLFIGVEGGIVSMPTVATQDMYRYFWNQVF